MGLLNDITGGILNNPLLQAHAVATAVGAVMGFTPQVTQDSQGNGVVTFTPAQEEIAAAYLASLLSGQATRAPGASSASKAGLKINMGGILARVIIKKYWFVPIIPFVSGFITGRKSK